MMREYQIVYRLQDGVRASGPLMGITVKAKSEAAAIAAVKQPDVEIVSVTEIRPLLDWSQEIFDLEEAGEVLRGTGRKVQHLQAEGKLVSKFQGRPLFTKRQLMQLVEEGKAA